MRRYIVFALCLPFSLAILCSNVYANTISAASCSASDVQTAVNSASSGDTVMVPSGNCTWSSPVTVSGRSVVLQGQTACTGSGNPSSNNLSCADNTVINITVPQGLAVSGGAAGLITVTGFTFVTNVSTYSGAINLSGSHGQAGIQISS